MSLTREDVEKVALLARLRLSAAELDKLTAQMGQILDYMALLGEVDTRDVEPMAHAVEIANVLRDDVSRAGLPREAALANAPQHDEQCYLVPAVLGG
jgi:aspartyl-tRNA(Asn)/glutamyl-tRNA(Gln) amidotransferase subunit C